MYRLNNKLITTHFLSMYRVYFIVNLDAPVHLISKSLRATAAPECIHYLIALFKTQLESISCMCIEHVVNKLSVQRFVCTEVTREHFVAELSCLLSYNEIYVKSVLHVSPGTGTSTILYF